MEGFRQQSPAERSPVSLCVEFQRLGPNAGGCAGRGLSGCWSCDVVCVRLVTGTALGVVGSRFAICCS